MIKALWKGSAIMRGGPHATGEIYTDLPMQTGDKREVYVLVFAHEEVEYLRAEAAEAAIKLRAYAERKYTPDKHKPMLIEAVRYDTYKRLLERLGASTGQSEDWIHK